MKLLYKPENRKTLKVKKKEKPKSNLGRKGFVMDRKSFLNWYDW